MSTPKPERTRFFWRPGLRADLDRIRDHVQPEQISQLDEGQWPRNEETDRFFWVNFRTLVDGHTPIAILGVIPFWKGVARGVALISEEGLRRPLMLTRGARGFIREAFDVLELVRLEVTVDARHRQATDWAEVLGFQYEGTLRCYGPDGSHHMVFSRLWR